LDEGYAWVHIYDASGKELLSNKYEEQKIGWNSIIINTDVLRSGLFVGKIVFTTHDNKISTGHLNLLRCEYRNEEHLRTRNEGKSILKERHWRIFKDCRSKTKNKICKTIIRR